MLTLQQIFDSTLEKLNQAGRVQSVAIGGKCAYRGNDGAKCAVGLWIPDDMYNVEWENMGIFTLSSLDDFADAMASAGIKVGPHEPEMDLLNDLQVFHDNYLVEGVSHWRQVNCLTHLADEHGLTFNPSQWEEQE